MKNRQYYLELKLELFTRSASLYRSAESLSKLAPHHPSQDKRFAKAKNSFKLRLRPTLSPAAPAPPAAPTSQSESLKLRIVIPSVSRDNAERTESGSSGGKRELEESKGRLSIKLKLPKSSSAYEGGGQYPVLLLSFGLTFRAYFGLERKIYRSMSAPSIATSIRAADYSTPFDSVWKLKPRAY